MREGKPLVHDDETRIPRLQLRHEDFATWAFTEGCPGCQAMLSGASGKGHSELCRLRVKEAIHTSPEALVRVCRRLERDNDKFADAQVAVRPQEPVVGAREPDGSQVPEPCGQDGGVQGVE